MEGGKQEPIDKRLNNEIQSEFQSFEARKKRFIINSKNDRFLFEGLSGSFLMPNSFATIEDTQISEKYFLFRRVGFDRFDCFVFCVDKSGVGFSFYRKEGFIFDFYQEIERNTYDLELMDFDSMSNAVNEAFKNISQFKVI